VDGQSWRSASLTAATEATLPAEPTMIELTVNETRRLNNAFLIEPVRGRIHRLYWSGRQRQHQLRAKDPTTPAASPSNPSHDHKRRLPY
jgi:hypothetical protein